VRNRVLIVGTGIVGLATAYQLSKKRDDVEIVVIDKENSHSAHQTGHNSGVIHSGLYYKPGSLKAKNCIAGYHLLIDFAREHAIPFDLCGKIVVATRDEELPYLDMLFNRGKENGLDGITMLSGDQLKEYEPHVAGIKGMFVPQTGIIDYKDVSEKLVECIRKAGHEIRYGSEVKSITKKNEVITGTSNGEILSDLIVTCSGLHSDRLASMIHESVDFRIIPFRGEYYQLKPEKESLVKNLIYPVPDPNFPFLGVHFTRMMKGGVEAGPNAVLAYAREGYTKSNISVSELAGTFNWPGFRKVAGKYWKTGLGEFYRSYSKSAFTKALQRLLPEIQKSDLVKGGAGVRAQACDRNGGLIDDFLIMENEWSVSVCNAPSPAATSSLSIGNTVADKVINLM
jgi:L-2-hydroxyglutarate oxidase